MLLLHALILSVSLWTQTDVERLADRWTQYVQEGKLEALDAELQADVDQTRSVLEILLKRFDTSIHSDRNRPEQRRVRYSESLLDAGIEIAARFGHHTGERAPTLRFRARRDRVIATEMLNNKQHRQALEKIGEVRRTAEEIGDRDFLYSTYMTAAYAYLELGESENAVNECLTSLTLAKELQDPVKTALAYYNVGAAYLHVGRFEDSLPYSMQAADTAAEIGNRVWEANARLNAGTAQMLARDYGDAEREFTAALDLAQGAGNALATGRALHNLGLLYHAREEWGRAREFLERSLPLVRDVDIRHSHEIDEFNRVEMEVLELLLECFSHLDGRDSERVEGYRNRLAELKAAEHKATPHTHPP